MPRIYESIRRENMLNRMIERKHNLKNLIKTHTLAEIQYLSENRPRLALHERNERERYESILASVESEIQSLQ